MIEPMGQQICNRGDYRIIRRHGAIVPFNPRKIATAMTKGFLAVTGTSESGRSSGYHVVADVATAGAEGTVASSGADGGSGEGGGSGGDDGDGDGPRR